MPLPEHWTTGTLTARANLKHLSCTQHCVISCTALFHILCWSVVNPTHYHFISCAISYHIPCSILSYLACTVLCHILRIVDLYPVQHIVILRSSTHGLITVRTTIYLVLFFNKTVERPCENIWNWRFRFKWYFSSDFFIMWFPWQCVLHWIE